MFLYFLFRLFYPPKWIVRTLAFISVWNCALRPVSLLMSPDMWTMIHSKSIRNECESCVFLLLLLRRPDIPSPTLKANTECASRRAHTHTHTLPLCPHRHVSYGRTVRLLTRMTLASDRHILYCFFFCWFLFGCRLTAAATSSPAVFASHRNLQNSSARQMQMLT